MSEASRKRALKGRGSPLNPPNRFEKTHYERDEPSSAASGERDQPPPRTEYFADHSRSIISENDSPDIPFRYSLNPYRGCAHGCSYCYARPTHEYLGLSAGLDFESKILVKHDAARLFRQFLCRPGWKPEPILLSGVTDPYQPAERTFQITRQCLEAALEARQPLDLITKNALVLRDLPILKQLAARRLVRVFVSLTTLDSELARTMEPRTSTPRARLAAIRGLAEAAVPVQVMAAPIIPGLNDSEIPALLAAAADAGAMGAGYVLLRLPLAVGPIFLAWLDQHRPAARKRIENAIRATRAGSLNASAFGERMRGQGFAAEQLAAFFKTFARRHGLDRRLPDLDCTQFRPPRPTGGQGMLF